MNKVFKILLLAIVLMSPVAMYADGDNADVTEVVAGVAAPSVVVRGGVVEIENPGTEVVDVAIFTITGVQVHNSKINASDNEQINLPAGCYIVKVGKVAKRVAIR